MLKPGDLCFYDGWYGIMLDIGERIVIFGNGLPTQLTEEEIESLRPVGRDSFLELIEAYKLRHDPSVQITRIL
jgi:hypothetical protein